MYYKIDFNFLQNNFNVLQKDFNVPQNRGYCALKFVLECFKINFNFPQNRDPICLKKGSKVLQN